MSFLKNETISDFCKNRIALEAVLEQMCLLISPIVVNKKEFVGTPAEFAAKYIDRPSEVLGILEENRRSFLYALADQMAEEELECTPGEYLVGLRTAVCVLSELTSPFVPDKDLCYEAYLNKSRISDLCDYVLTGAVCEVAMEGYFDSKVSEVVNSSETEEDFVRNACGYLLHASLVPKRRDAAALLKKLVREWDSIYTDSSISRRRLYYYLDQFERLFSPTQFSY